MKKITFVLFTFLAFQWGNAQSTSFESAQGFTLGNLNGQNGWTVFAASPNIPVVTDSQSTDGSYSIQLIATNGQANSGGFSPLFTSNLDVVLTVDMFLSSTTGELSDTDFIAQSPSQSLLTSRVKFSFDGSVLIVDNPGTGTAFITTTETVIRDAWFELKIEYRFSAGEILYYIDNNLIYTGTVFGGTNVEQYIALFDNFESDAYFDNITYSDGTILSVDEFDNNTFKHFYNKDTDVLTMTSSTLAFDNVELYNLLGQQVLNTSLSQTRETVNMSLLEDGVYLAKVSIQGRTQTVKILKN